MNQRTRKPIISFILCFSLVLVSLFTLMPLDVKADAGHDVSFDIGGANGATGTVQYKINGGEWTPVANNGSIDGSTLNNNDTIYVKGTPGNGYGFDQGNLQNSLNYDGSDHDILAALSANNFSFTYEEKSYQVRIRFDNSGSGPGATNPEVGKYKFSIAQEVAGSTGTVKLEFLNSSGDVIGTTTATDNTDDASIPDGTVKFRVSMANDASRDILNNIRMERFPRPANNTPDEVDLIDDIRREESPYSLLNVDPASKGYLISVVFSNTMSVSWSYDESERGSDRFVEHARIELLNSDNATDFTQEGRYDWQLTIGETYYFVLIPDYGYQVSSLVINNVQPIAPMNSVGVFSFEMSHSNFHFQGIVSPANDITEFDNGGILGGLDVNAADAVDSGNVRLTEQDVADDTRAVSAIAGGGASLFGTVDLSLDQIISKGNGSYWETNLTDLANPATIRMIVPAGELADGQTYSVVRNHNGVREELNAVYYADEEALVFESDKFSTFSIVKRPGTPVRGSSGTDSSGSGGSERPLPSLSDSLGGVEVTTWDEFNNIVQAKPDVVKSHLVQLILNPATANIPASVFQNIASTKAIGVHLFTGKGSALTFLNGGKISAQSAVNLHCSTDEQPGKRIINFESYDKLTAAVLFHSIVPAGSTKVSIYYTGVDGNRVLLSTQSPTAEGRFCFPITSLGHYELEYE